MLMLTVQILENFPDARKKWQKAFRYVLVDEYQDNNHVQYRLLQLLAEQELQHLRRGDSNESIYAFRGADIRTSSSSSATSWRRARSRLSRTTVYQRDPGGHERRHLAQLGAEGKAALVRAWRGRPRACGRGRGRASEARYVAAQIAGLVDEGYAGSEIAVFYRMNAQSRVLEQTLRLHQIGYQVIGGPRFYERAEVKDATAYLQVLDNPADAVSLMRIANRPKLQSARRRISRLVAYAESHGLSLFEALDRPVGGTAWLR